MNKLLNFFLETEKLKTMPRTGWVLRRVKNPETISEHVFGVTFLTWLLSRKKNLSIKRAIKIALCHDICEVYAGDMTPFFYYTHLPEKPKNKKEKEKIYQKWVRLSKKEKEKRGKKKFKIEKKSLLKLIKDLKPLIHKEIFSHWFDYEKRISREGKFVKQVDRIETLIQSIEYFGTEDRVKETSWWEGTEEVVDDTLLLEFLKVIQEKFYGTVIGEYSKDKELKGILDFLVEIGKLKQMPRTIWVSLGIKKPETVASHIFTVSLMAWVFGKEKKNLDMERLLKMALCHEISAVYTGDLISPYEKDLPKNRKKRREVFREWPHLSQREKKKKFLKDYKKEQRALKKLTSTLNPLLRKEILQLWKEYKTMSTPEARFLHQINVCAVLLQALQYKKADKDLPIGWLWEWAFEKCENAFSLGFMEELKKRFYRTNLFFKAILNLLHLKK